MRHREIKVGMHVKHRGSGKDMGEVVSVGTIIVTGKYPFTNTPWIATPAELIPA